MVNKLFVRDVIKQGQIYCTQGGNSHLSYSTLHLGTGFVNTTNACNFFIVRKEQVWTSTGDYCMNGITRQKVIDLCKENNIED